MSYDRISRPKLNDAEKIAIVDLMEKVSAMELEDIVSLHAVVSNEWAKRKRVSTVQLMIFLAESEISATSAGQ